MPSLSDVAREERTEDEENETRLEQEAEEDEETAGANEAATGAGEGEEEFEGDPFSIAAARGSPREDEDSDEEREEEDGTETLATAAAARGTELGIEDKMDEKGEEGEGEDAGERDVGEGKGEREEGNARGNGDAAGEQRGVSTRMMLGSAKAGTGAAAAAGARTVEETRESISSGDEAAGLERNDWDMEGTAEAEADEADAAVIEARAEVTASSKRPAWFIRRRLYQETWRRDKGT